MRESDQLKVFHTGNHVCGYFPDRIARDLLLDPRNPYLAQHYGLALSWGFRRSGDLVYRPHCQQCRACVAVRIPVDRFHPNRSQRRTLAHNQDIDVRVVPADRTDEHLALYQQYLRARHAGGGMDDHGAAEFEQFLVGRWSDGRFLELRLHHDQRLLAVAVTDRSDDALSAVYTFYAPDQQHRGLGTLAILHQIEWARRERRHHLYLGYWIAGHHKMDYKRHFRPLEGFDGRHWHPMQFKPDATPSP